MIEFDTACRRLPLLISVSVVRVLQKSSRDSNCILILIGCIYVVVRIAYLFHEIPRDEVAAPADESLLPLT